MKKLWKCVKIGFMALVGITILNLVGAAVIATIALL